MGKHNSESVSPIDHGLTPSKDKGLCIFQLSDEVASPEPKTSTPVQPETNSVSEPPEEKENESAATLQKEDNSRSEIECYDNEALIMYDEEPLKQVPTTELWTLQQCLST